MDIKLVSSSIRETPAFELKFAGPENNFNDFCAAKLTEKVWGSFSSPGKA